MSEKINAVKAAFLLGQVVTKDRKDYTYFVPNGNIGCVYFTSDGCPSCIVGHVASAAGFGKDSLKFQNDARFHATTFARDHFTKKAIVLLRLAQRYQDNHYTWGQSVEKALAEAEITSFDDLF
jgi:hypothetical protein